MGTWEFKRLDLTVEAAVLLPEWADLFTDDERAIAAKRLTDYRFDDDAHLRRKVSGAAR